MSAQKTIIIAPLNWGLGHAARCAPVIQTLLEAGRRIVLAGDGLSIEWLSNEFPDLDKYYLEGYNVEYPKSGSMFLSLLRQTPGLLKVIAEEQKQITALGRKVNADLIISDSRFGCYSDNVRSVFLSHQINIPLEKHLWWFRPAVQKQNHHYLKKFDQIWVPDFEDHLLSGKMSIPPDYLKSKVQFIGPLSRLEKMIVEQEDFVLLLLSGPEPQRSILEKILIERAAGISEQQFILIRGTDLPLETAPPNNVSFIHLADSSTINEHLLKAKHIICRSGYSTVMDLVRLNRSACFIPTPGQTEQKVLAEHLSKQFDFVYEDQHSFGLVNTIKKLEAIKNPEDKFPPLPDIKFFLDSFLNH